MAQGEKGEIGQNSIGLFPAKIDSGLDQVLAKVVRIKKGQIQKIYFGQEDLTMT